MQRRDAKSPPAPPKPRAPAARRDDRLSVGEMAERAGVAVSTLHFYEARGLVRSHRSAGNQRRYRRDELRRLAVIRIAQRVGLPLEAIRAALATLPDERAPTLADWRRLSTAWRAELDERIAQMLSLRDQLTDCIGCGCLSLQRCRLRNPGDELASHGAGPRRLIEGAEATEAAEAAEAAAPITDRQPAPNDPVA